MNIQSLMSAAHAAGFAMAVSDEFMDEEPVARAAPLQAQTEAAVAKPTGTALALAMPVHSRAAWIRDWLLAWRAGAPA